VDGVGGDGDVFWMGSGLWLFGVECGGGLRYHFLFFLPSSYFWRICLPLGECGVYDEEKMRREKTDESA